ncbi:MAG: ABC transporter permease [Candidatus Marinimicrobia bacterium]|nr:ABC transporter permease [Candidatus Neomarinimicrobiota bacterium]
MKNPVPTIILFLVTTIVGFWGYNNLRVNHQPDLEFPTVIVNIIQPGAAPSELENQIARKVEDSVISLGDVRQVRSSLNEGISVTIVEFELGKDVDRAVNDVRDAISKIRSELPAGILEPSISRVENSGGRMIIYTVTSDDLTVRELSWLIDNDISRSMLEVPGVAIASRIGGVDREILVNLNPDRLMALGITAADVSRQLKTLNVDRPGGRGTIGATEQSIRTLGSARSVEDLREVSIILPGGRHARLEDLGEVTDGVGEIRQLARFNGEPVVGFSIERQVGSSEVHIARGVTAAVKEFERTHPNIHFKMIYSAANYTGEMFMGAMEALLLGTFLAVGVVWWFLRDTRATLISAFAMPMSIIPTFAFMYLMGFTLNNITMVGLSMVVGILVDDAIVEMENIIRHMRMGKRPYDAAMLAADEIGMPVVATSFSIVAVFLPVALIPGVPGQFFWQFGLTVSAAVLFSLLIARMLTPLMGAFLLKHHGETNRDSALLKNYLRFLRWALQHRRITLAGGVGFFIFSLLLLPLIERDLFPVTDKSQSNMTISLPPGATLDETEISTNHLTEILMSRPEVENVFIDMGGRGRNADVRNATAIINLTPKSDRALSQSEFETSMRPILNEIPGIRMRFGAGQKTATTGTSITMGSDDPIALEKAVQKLEREMRSIPGLGNVGSNASLQRPELIIEPNLDVASELGVSVQAISTTAQIATMGANDDMTPKFNLPDRQIPIRVHLVEEARGNLGTLKNLRVPIAGGRSVPLSAVADISFGSGPAEINRMDRRRIITISAEISGKPLGQVQREIQALPAFKNLPDTVQQISDGPGRMFNEIFGYIGSAIAFAAILVYGVLVILFSSFVHPLTIMTSLPLSLGGALLLLMATGSALSMPAVIGVLMLLGIVAKNSILLVEYTVVAIHERGLSRYDALMDAAHKRAKPIVMTTVAMSAGMLPIALEIGADAEFRSSMAIVVIGGLITSTALSLVFVPVAFTYMDDLQKYLAPYFRPFISGAHQLPPGHARDSSTPAE